MLDHPIGCPAVGFSRKWAVSVAPVAEGTATVTPDQREFDRNPDSNTFQWVESSRVPTCFSGDPHWP